jgi:hypothetical protein
MNGSANPWRSALRALVPMVLAGWAGCLVAQAENPGAFVQFVPEDDATCMMREGKMALVRSSHPSRLIRCWLERYHIGVPTGDRSHSDLKPAGDPEKLGCSRTDFGKQEWRIVRAQFID